jgi:hypothetical protein
VPDAAHWARTRELRDLTRHHRTLAEERTRVVRRLEKVMQDAGIKPTSVASALLTKSGRAILEALLASQDDSDALARGRLRAKIPAAQTLVPRAPATPAAASGPDAKVVGGQAAKPSASTST